MMLGQQPCVNSAYFLLSGSCRHTQSQAGSWGMASSSHACSSKEEPVSLSEASPCSS